MAIRETTVENNTPDTLDGVTLQVKKLERHPQAPDRAAIAGISMHIPAGELVIVAGPAKSALLETLAGLRPPDDGQVLFNGADLYGNLRVLSGYISYVPPEIPLHESLTPRETLRYQARLRLADAAGEQVEASARGLLAFTGLQAVADLPLSGLGNLDKRLLCIACELVTPPALLLVDEPAPNLAPAEALKITMLLQSLTRQGLTVLQASDTARCAILADKLAVLAPDGSLAWFGPSPEALEYFRPLHPDAEYLNSSFNLDHALEVPVLTQTVDGKSLGTVFMDQPYFQKYVSGPLSGKRSDLVLEDRPLTRFRGAQAEGQPPPQRARPPALKKAAALLSRNALVTRRSRRFLVLLLAPVLLALTDLLFSTPGMNDPTLGDPRGQPAALGALVFLNMLTTALVFQNEVFGERRIFHYERRGLRLAFPYALSKIVWAGAFAVWAGIVWAVVHFLASGFSGGFMTLGGYALTFILVAFIGGGLGLIASAVGRSALAASTLALLFILPQFLLSGSVIPLANLAQVVRPLSWVNPTRYAFDILLTLSDYGQDVVADPCWQIDKGLRTLLSDTEKQSCDCMGESIFSSCSFPGIYRSFNYVIEQPRPIPPTPDPRLEAPPVQPQPQPGQSQEEFQQAVADYNQQLEAYLAAEAAYDRSLQDFTRTLEGWQRLRSLAIGSAEASIADALDHYGHAFNVPLVSYWFILSGISLVLIVLMLILIPR